MSAAARILAEIEQLGASVEDDGGKLKLRTGKTPLPRELVDSIKAAKAEILDLLDPERSAIMGIEREADATNTAPRFLTRAELRAREKALRFIGRLWADGIQLSRVGGEVSGELTKKQQRTLNELIDEIWDQLVPESR